MPDEHNLCICQRKGNGKSAATTKKQRAEFYLSKQATGAIDRLVVLGFSHQGPMAHI